MTDSVQESTIARLNRRVKIFIGSTLLLVLCGLINVLIIIGTLMAENLWRLAEWASNKLNQLLPPTEK